MQGGQVGSAVVGKTRNERNQLIERARNRLNNGRTQLHLEIAKFSDTGDHFSFLL